MKSAAIFMTLIGAANARMFGSQYETYKNYHGKNYAVNEDDYRYNIFQESMQLVDTHNADESKTYELEMNRFADMSWDEFKKEKLGAGQNCSATTGIKKHTLLGGIPDRVDWREKDAVSPVKDQGSCGSCWTFSTTGSLESHNFLKHGKMEILSEQQLVDCAQDFDNHGCNGGLPSHAFQYIHYNGGLDTEEAYPYKATDGTCVYSPKTVGVQVQDAYNITYQDEDDLLKAIATVGPVSVAFQVASDFRLYKSGVYDSDVCKNGPQDVNHAVLAVGYDVDKESGKPYWIVKNSWSETWGIDGYFWIKRGDNMCGISDCASYPIVV